MAFLREFSYSFQANERTVINATGNVVRCVTGAALFQILPSERERIDMIEGLGMSFETDFKKLVIVNGSTPQTIKVYIGDGQILDSRLYGSLTVNTAGSNTLTDAADITTAGASETNTIAANGDRSRLIIQSAVGNSGTAANYPRVGPNAAAGRGIAMTPGSSYIFNSSAEISVFCLAAGTIFRYIEESNT